MKRITLFIAFIVQSCLSWCQFNAIEFVRYADSLANMGIQKGEIPGAILSIVQGDNILLVKSYGYADLNPKIPVSADSTLFQLGSVGKIITAIAVLQQVESGTIDLNEDLNEILNVWKIENPYDSAVTLHYLLTHSAGFDERLIGYMARQQNEVLPLGKHLSQRMPDLFQEPGLNINYSNYGYALAGHLVELVSNMEFTDYVAANILRPLEMIHSSYFLPDDYIEREQYAKGYQWRETTEFVPSYPRHAIPAGSILSSGSDMAKFLKILITKDKLLDPQSFELIYNRQFSNHEMLNGYTYGFEEQNINGHRAISKGGSVPGFLSLLAIYPDLNFGFFISVNTETDNFLSSLVDSLHQKFFAAIGSEIFSYNKVNVKPYTGIYRNDRANHHSIEDMFALFEGDFEIWESDDGFLSCFHDGKIQKYAARDSFIFSNLNNPNQHMVFELNDGKPIKMYRNFNFSGFDVPASFSKLSWLDRPRFLNDELPFLLLFIPGYLTLLLYWFGSFVLIRVNKQKYSNLKLTTWPYHFSALLFTLLFLVDILFFFVPLVGDVKSGNLFFGMREGLVHFKYLHVLLCLFVLLLLVQSVRIWKTGHWLFTKIYFCLFSLAGLVYVLVLYRWHFVGMVY